MKKYLLGLFVILLLAGCSSNTIKEDTKLTPAGDVKDNGLKLSTVVFANDVTQLSVEGGVQNLKVAWHLENNKNADKIEILTRQNGSKIYKTVQKLESTTTGTVIKAPEFINMDVLVRLIGKDGSISSGKSVEKTYARLKNVIYDTCEGRGMQIYLPDGYETSVEKYPVIYMHDGQNVFSKKTAPNGEWMIDETMDKLVAEGKVPKMIVVAIYNSSDRSGEYTPYEFTKTEKEWGIGGNSGHAKEYSEFIVKKIIPYIDGKYRTIADRNYRAVMGSSFGGILAFWMAWNYSDVFSMAGAFSPSFWVGNGEILREVEKSPKKDIKIWIDQGTEEFGISPRLMVDILKSKGYEYGKNLFYYEDNKAEHNEIAWANRGSYPIIVFKGQSSSIIKNIKIEKEYVVDEDSHEYEFPIINPMVEYDNGLKYSLYDICGYKISGNAKINEARIFPDEDNKAINYKGIGIINPNGEKEIEVTINYLDNEIKIILDEKDMTNPKKKSKI